MDAHISLTANSSLSSFPSVGLFSFRFAPGRIMRTTHQLVCPISNTMIKFCLFLAFVLSLVINPCGRASEKSAFDVEKETRAYLDRVPRDKKAQSDAYFEGGYWLQLWAFVCGAAIAALLVQGRLSARMRDLAQQITR